MSIKASKKNMLSSIRPEHFVCFILVIATLTVYWRIITHEFINLDDHLYVTGNYHVQGGLSFGGLIWAFTSTHAANWHPITWLSHMLDIELYGMNSSCHHLTNLILHTANALLLFFVLRRMTSSLWSSAFVAALFALHPLHVESVAWVSERKDVLSTFFWILTMGAYALYAERPGVNRYIFVLLLFVLGLMAKPMLVTLPFVLLLLDFWPLNRFQCGRSNNVSGEQRKLHNFRLVLEKTPLFVVAVASSVVTIYSQRSLGAVGSFDAYPLGVRISNALVSYASYIGKMIWPCRLSVFYPHELTISWPMLAVACLLMLSLFVLAIKTIKNYPWFAVGWLWYVGTLVPVIGLVQVGSQAMADRYTYIPLIGLFIVIGYGVPVLTAGWRLRKAVYVASAFVFLSALAASTWVQAGRWRNSVEIFRHALNVTHDNYVVHNNLGVALASLGKFNEAVIQYRQALAINPMFVEAHINLGDALSNQGRAFDAIRHFKKALEIDPLSCAAHLNLGVVKARKGNKAAAIAHFERALEINPGHYEVHGKLGDTLAGMGRLEAAMAHYVESLRINPRFVEGHNNIGVVLILKGKVTKAITHFREAVRLRPGYVDARRNLIKALKAAGKNVHYNRSNRL